MFRHRGDPLGLPRPPTPYPFQADQSRGATENLQSDRPPALEERPRLYYEYVLSQHYRARPSELVKVEKQRPSHSRTRLAQCRTVADANVRRQILAQNARISRRTPPLCYQAFRASGPKQVDQPRVRFQLPGRYTEIHYPGADLVEVFEGLQIGARRSRSPQCSSCGRQLWCRKCGVV
ncbi:hypothetical protein N656DRAFT_785769, partial [Canariomyces notabilis]